MRYDIILSRKNNHYIARAKEWPEVTVTEASRDAAVEQLKSKLFDYLTNQVEVIQVDIPMPLRPDNLWHNQFGCCKDDPTFDDLQGEILLYRQQCNAEQAALTE